jgi:hypothetical protein
MNIAPIVTIDTEEEQEPFLATSAITWRWGEGSWESPYGQWSGLDHWQPNHAISLLIIYNG